MFRLTPRERKILSAIQLQANTSLKELAAITGFQEHAIHYCIQGLKERSIIRRRPMTDVHLMGYTQYSVFFTPLFESANVRHNLMKLLVESEKTSDIFELGGDYQYGVVLTVRDIQEVYDFLNILSRMKGLTIADKILSTRISTSLFQRSYLGRTSNKTQHITYRRSDKRIELDQTDHQILKAMHRNPEASLRSLGQILQMPHTSIANRVSILEEKKAIIGYVYGVASQHFGMQAYRLIVHTKGFDYDSWKRLFNFAANHPNILCLFQCIGSWDYEFEIEVENRQDVANVSQEIHEFLANSIISIRNLPIFSFPKSTGYPFSQKFIEGADIDYLQ